MDWVRLSKLKEQRRIQNISNSTVTRSKQLSNLRDITNGVFSGSAMQLSRENNRRCIAHMGNSQGNCSKVG